MSETDEALDHPRRERIYEAVKESPGLNWSQLQRETGLSVGALMFHLDRLVESEVVTRKESPRSNEVLLFTKEDEDMWRDPRVRMLFGNASTRKVAEILTENPGSIAGDIADELGVTPEAVRYHLSKLEEESLVERERDGRKVRYDASGKLDDWVGRLQRSPDP
jgi:predicted transcriptional regulator